MNHRALAGAVIVLLTLAGYFVFPGHTFLQSDTQIYLPMLEHYADPGVLSRDMIATHPHLSFTIYDEVALALHRATGASFRTILGAQQIVFRAFGILGVYLIAASLGLGLGGSLLVASVYSLGATVLGPSVLTLEYEPIPRGYAVPLLMAAIGFASHGRMLASEVCASLAFLYHPPTVFPFWLIYFVLTLWPSNPATMARRIRGLIPIFVAVLILFVLSRHQPGVAESQQLFGQVPADQESQQRYRAPYNWVSLWWRLWMGQYVFLFAAACAALWRVWREASQELRFFAAGMPVAGMLSLPLSYLLLEKLKWVVVPQFQPARALLFVTTFAVILGVAAAVLASRKGRWAEALLWLLVPYAVPLGPRLSEVLLPHFSNAALLRRFVLVLLFAALGAAALGALAAKKRWAAASLAAAMAAPFLLAPAWGNVSKSPDLLTPDLRALSAWARTATPADAVFLFPEARRDLAPGIFRALALRAVYTDWKAGGQVNFHRKLGEEWRRRWDRTMAVKFKPGDVEFLRASGIDYLVFTRRSAVAAAPVYENATYTVYRIGGEAGK